MAPRVREDRCVLHLQWVPHLHPPPPFICFGFCWFSFAFCFSLEVTDVRFWFRKSHQVPKGAPHPAITLWSSAPHPTFVPPQQQSQGIRPPGHSDLTVKPLVDGPDLAPYPLLPCPVTPCSVTPCPFWLSTPSPGDEFPPAVLASISEQTGQQRKSPGPQVHSRARSRFPASYHGSPVPWVGLKGAVPVFPGADSILVL